MFQPNRIFFGVLIAIACGLHVLQDARCPSHRVVAGVIYPPIFTLQEYLAHRFLLHEIPGRASKSHAGHHRHHIDPGRIFVPVPVTMFLALTTAMASWLIDPHTMPSVVMSMILGYLLFEFSHYAAHVPQETRLLHALRKHHLVHHSKSDTKYGFISAAWDITFGTYGGGAMSPWLLLPYPVLPFVLSSAGVGEWVSLIVAALPLMVNADEDVYATYHQDVWNRVVHVVCVPILVWSVLACLARIPVANGVTMAHVTSITFMCSRISTVSDVFTMAWMFVMACHVSSRRYSMYVILVSHVVSWWIQIVVGHCLLERSRPALFASLIPSLLVAPVAVTRDVMAVGI